MLCIAAFLMVLAADLPVRQVVLYKHGVGYFERAGEIKAGQTAQLEFKASQMDDVIKSLTIEDSSGARITGLRYDSSEPVERKLAVFPFRLGPAQALAAFLDQVKGARIEMKFGSESLAGALVAARVLAAGDKQPEREQVILMLDSGELRVLDLLAAASVRLADTSLQGQLRDYLAAVAGARSRENRNVYIDSTGSATRRVTARYMIPTPVWKATYRLNLREKAEPLLEGWAVVDNTTGEDWSGVGLALVSGRPISFVSRLYEPRYRERPVAELPEDKAVAPALHAGAIAGLPPAPPAKSAPAPARMTAERRKMEAELTADFAASREMISSVAPVLEAREAGELFEYRFAQPVTVRKNESAMLPFLRETLAVRKLLIYSDGGGQYPMNAAELTNSTGKTMDGGPITVFDHGAYAGEALMETLKAADKRLISYAVDIGTRITTRPESGREAVREVHIRRGIMTTRSAVEETKVYTIRNVDQKPKTLVIEHPLRPGYKLLNQKPSETTASAYRFEVPLKPASAEKFPVAEERTYETSTMMANLTPDVLVSYIQNKALSEAARRDLERILRQKRSIAEADAALRRGETEINDLARDQDRVRQNIASLGRVSGQQEQVQKYARELAAQETRLAALRDMQSELRQKKSALESELNSLLEKMEF